MLRGAPTRPLARPRAEMPLKLPEAWRAEPPRCLALLSAQLCPGGRNPSGAALSPALTGGTLSVPRAAKHPAQKQKSLRLEAFVLLTGDTRRCIAFYDNI
ncbi:hypothetical protein DBY66_015570 [Pantoea sp. RIT413]|nr:hypothetical protein DBY66_015570 [Pantoea sp. RIT 413]